MVLEEQEDIVVARISVRCFRLLALVSEVQNEVEVVKPILQELEVMRLSCALGMLANVNAKDFEHDMLEASEFDDDFARFLRQELFGGRNGDDDASASHHVSVTSAFGKQSEVKYHLQKLNAWDDDMERHLRERDQGIYAVLLPDDTMSDEVASPKLVLFGWLVDCLFEPEHLRDTPTYILRFLTCLSSNVTCCLSTKDCLSLQAVVSAMDSSDMDDWKSYSVGFRVELAEDEKDSVRVNSVRSMELPTVNGARQMRVIKGSFPGLAAVADVRREKAEFTSRLTFKDALALSNWLVERSTTSQVHVDSSQLDMKIREAVIVASNMWPDSKLEEIDIQYNAELVQAEEAAKMEIERVVSEEQVALMEAAKVLFCVDVLEDHKRTQEALDVVQTSLEALASVNTVLEAARDRFQEAYCVLVHVIREMRPTMVLFMAGLEDELCTSLQKPPNLYALSKAKNKWQNLRASLKSMCDGTPVGRGFRDRMMTPLETMREGWWASVAAILDVYRQKSLPFLVDKRSREVAISRESAARAAVDDAFQDLIGEWSRPHDSGSSLKIDARCRKGKIICACKEMTWVPQGERMLVWKLCSDKEPSSADALSMLGEFRLHGGETVMGVFSVQHTSLIVVSTSADRCFLRRVQFPLDPNVSKRRNRIVATEIRSFTRDVVLCDFSVENRMLALMDRNNNVGLLRFDEKFTFLEQTKTINVDERTSLVIPVVSIAVSDGMLYALDCEGSMQSVNLRSMQTSKKRCDKTLCSREDKWQSDLFFLQGEAVLGSLEATRHERDAVGKLHVMSIDDYRLLPEVEGASIKLAATEQLSAYVQGESLYVLDGCQLHIVAIHATIRSSSFRMQSDCANVDDDASQQTKLSSHWLWALYHLYEKFPVSGLLEVCCGGPMAKERTPMKLTVVIPAGDAQAAQDFVRVVMENLQKLNKPLYGLGLSGNLTVKQTSSCSGDFFSTTTTAGFLERMVTIVPIQICRAEYNSLTVMQNGQDQPDDFVDGLSNEHQSTEIAQSIRFGLLSPLLQSWGGQCVVITSMGKQSTGKSYFLNHLTGSSFAIAGARCTDGAWMCVRVLSNDVLLVVIDFEGLGSFERTEQEDVFLSVLNASISMLTVFRMEMRFDKEIDDLFSKFQKGSRLIKNDPLLFRGKLYMSVKDVNPNDQREIVREIVTKFRRLMDVNKEHSFLTDMYTGQLEVNCSPPLGTSGYYRSLTQVQRFIETRLCGNSNGGFLTGKAFLDCIRLVLAKISILDWTSMSESAFKLKISTMRAQLPGIVRFGTITSISNTTNDARVADMEELVDPTSGDVVSVAREEVYASQPSMQAAWTSMVIAKLTDKLDDSAIDLGILTCGTDSDRRNAVSLTIERLFRRFLQLQTGTSDASVTGTVQKEFDAFLAYVICRRRLRIQKWAKSKIGDQDSSEWKSVEKQQFIPLQSIGRCLGRCAHCYLGCMKAFGHLVDGHGHDCGTTHLCSSVCAYCAEENCVNVCAKKAGHEDRCECDAEDHTCGAPCSLRGAPNCGGGCAEKSGHDSDHRCSVGKHRCGQPCFVNNCEGRCVLDVELPHAEHRCESDRCVQSCGFEGCDRLCCSSDHLHGQGYHESAMSASQAISESVVAHLCGEEHECAELCDEDGICDLRVSQKHVLKTFAGARDTFRFTLQEMEGVRKKCTKSLPPGERLHLGSHSCAHQDEDKVHFCESRCPCCAYHCTKHQGHQGKHRTTHGNMRETLFVSDNHQIDFLDRKYQAGERGVAEMCNLFCSGAGRGHVHFLECEHRNALICQLTSGSKRRHCVKILEPPPSRAMDELLHEEFWGTLGWQDPCSSISERDSFKKCAYKCDSTEHDRDHASYCILPAWHTSELTPEANERDGFSYLDGHKFECQHAASGKRMHHVFVLDCSGSMRGQPWFKLMEAFHEYVNNRISAGASQDVMSVLTFSRTVEIVYEARDIMKMRDANVPFRGGETWYSEGLRGAHEVLSRMDSAKFTPVLVIFSDGRPHDPKRVDELGRRIRHSYERVGLQAFMVGAGRANLSYLQRLAQLMGGRYLHALHNTELKNQFQKISASVGAKMSLAVASRW